MYSEYYFERVCLEGVEGSFQFFFPFLYHWHWLLIVNAVLLLCSVPTNLPPSLNEACTSVAMHDHQMSLHLSTLDRELAVSCFLYYSIKLIIYTLIIRASSSV